MSQHLQRFISDLGVGDLSELPGIDQIAVEQIVQQLLRAERCKDHGADGAGGELALFAWCDLHLCLPGRNRVLSQRGGFREFR